MDTESETSQRLGRVCELIRQAGKLTWDYFEKRVETEIKSDATPVTVADRECEAFLRRELTRAFPGDGYLGEEHGEEKSSTGFRWIIDPIDATSNFVRHIPIYANLVGLEYEGHIAAGACFVPATGDLYRAQIGHGAFKNDERIHVSKVETLSEAQICYPDVTMFDRRGLTDFFLAITREARRSRGFGDYWQFLLVAEGSADLALEPYAAAWDLAALKPIIEEAGGVFTDWKGEPTIYSGGAIVANPAIHAIVMERLKNFNASR